MSSSVTPKLFIAGFILLFYRIATPPVVADENLIELARKVQPAVVTIICYDSQRKEIGLGSGFFINEKGHLITNYHVMQGATHAKIILHDKREYYIEYVMAYNEESDIIRLIINPRKPHSTPHESPSVSKPRSGSASSSIATSGISTDTGAFKIPFLSLSDRIPEIGEDVVAIGSPLGLEQTVSEGIVSGLHEIRKKKSSESKSSRSRSPTPSRPAVRGKSTEPEKHYLVQITAPISPGSSGGPVLTQKDGQVIGVATMQAKIGQNLNFAVPAVEIKDLQPVAQLKKLSEWTWGFNVDFSQENTAKQNREKLIGATWVISFQEQMEKEQIWDGENIVSVPMLESKYKALNRNVNKTRRSIIYPTPANYESGYYEHEGHIYTENEYAYFHEEPKTSFSENKAFQATGTIIDQVKEGRIVILEGFEEPILIQDRFPRVSSARSSDLKHPSLPYSSLQYDSTRKIIQPQFLIWSGEWVILENAQGFKKKMDLYYPLHSEASLRVRVQVHPPVASFNDYVWTVYCTGLEADIRNGLIEADAKCVLCQGKGLISCPLCKGKITCKLIGHHFQKPITKSGNEFLRQFSDSVPQRGKMRTIRCPSRCIEGRVGCPNCVLVGRPLYKDTKKTMYLQRWKDKGNASSQAASNKN